MDKDINKKFQMVDKAYYNKKYFENMKLIYEDKFKNNTILQDYLKILNQIELANKEINDAKSYMYSSMIDNNIDLLKGENINIKLKKPYEKTSLNTKLFLENYQPNTKMYKKYVNIINVKGSIIIEEVESNISK